MNKSTCDHIHFKVFSFFSHWTNANKKKFICIYWLIGLVGRVFANGLGDLGSIPGCIIPKILKSVLDTSLLNTQQYKGKVEQFRERSSALPYALML